MLTRVLRTVRLDTIDKRSQVGCALRKLKDELTRQCGGPDAVTPALALLIEQAAVKAIIARAVGEYVLKQECPVQKDQLIAVVMQHDTVQKTLALLLEKIGTPTTSSTLPTTCQGAFAAIGCQLAQLIEEVRASDALGRAKPWLLRQLTRA